MKLRKHKWLVWSTAALLGLTGAWLLSPAEPTRTLLAGAAPSKKAKPSDARPSDARPSDARPSDADEVRPLPNIQVWFGPKPADDPNGILHNMLRFIDSAEKSLYVSIHELDMVVVAEHIAKRADAGVDVQIAVEARWWRTSKTLAARQVITASRAKVILDTKIGGLMHNKFMIADGVRVWTGSTNMTETCILYNPNNAVWIDDEKLAENFLTEFKEQQAGKFGKKASGPPNTPYPTLRFAGGAKLHTFFSPEDDPCDAIIDAIQSAKKSVDIMVFVFSHPRISQSLIDAHKRGVKLRVLLDNSFASSKILDRWQYVPFRILTHEGVTCKYDDEKAKIHHKVVLVDSRIVVTGSFNLSAAAAVDNDENVLIIEHAPTAELFAAEFDRLWKHFTGDPGATPELEPGDEQQ